MDIRKSFRALGTVNTIAAFGCEDEAPLREAEELVLRFDSLWSVFRADSEISRLNASAGLSPVAVSADTMEILLAAKRFSAASFGSFSVTIGPLSGLWKQAIRSGTLPDEDDLKRAVSLVCDADILLDEQAGTAFLRRRGQAVDLGSIAKGYAADRVRDLLLGAGIRETVLNFGGTVVVTGRQRTIGIQHPRRPTGVPMGSLPLRDAAAVTSGDYEQGFELGGLRYSHLIDPRTGSPCRSGLVSVTLTGPEAMDLDAMTTAVFVLGAGPGLRIAERTGAEAVLVTEALDVYCTQGLRGAFTVRQNYGMAGV